MNAKQLATLCDMFTYCRPHNGWSVQAFCNRFIAPLPNAYADTHGNWHVSVGDSMILWSCHTDTVHWKDGYQTIHVAADGTIGLSKRGRKRSSCLGADDTVGVFLLREMILAGVPGHYVFHHGEESGGIGSRRLAKSDDEWLRTFSAAIALDRGGYRDIITYQGGSRCCSDAFAMSLAAALGMQHTPCENGIYTDTAEYTHLIPECTNVSVGYEHAHSRSETVNHHHVGRLLAALLKLDVSTLVIERDPSVIDADDDLYTYLDWRHYDDDVIETNDRYRDTPTYLDPEWQAIQDAFAREERLKVLDDTWAKYFSKRKTVQ